MSLEEREEKAVARWRPAADTWFNRFLAFAVVSLSRFIMGGMNSLIVVGADRYEALLSRGDRGLLTFSNHVSLFDDPLLLSCLRLPRYAEIRWVGADAINFFGSPLTARIFNAGKCVPIVRGAGLDQRGLDFLCDRLNEGAWVHIFPEGGRTRDSKALVTTPFKTGIGRLIAETRPIALPFYHYGMHEVLPVGSKVPRLRKKVRLVFGQPVDCVRLIDEMTEKQGTRLWDALTARSYEMLRGLELSVHPQAEEIEAVA